MNARIASIAANTFREAVRDRVLYNLIAFALLLSGAAIFVGQISIDIEKLVVINLGLTAVSLFGLVIAIFIGIGLVSKEIEKRTLYTVLSRPVRRWEFIVGKFFGLAGTLVVNTFFMAIGVFGALLYVAHHYHKPDAWILVALYFIVLQFLIICSLALLFSSFSSPLLSAVFAFSLFVIGSFAGFALLLASVGIYGAISYSVEQRTQEYGIRMALGASREAIYGMTLRKTATLGLAGLSAGVALALALGRIAGNRLYLVPHEHSGLLYGVSVFDPLTLTIVFGLLAAVALLAGYFPARRAMRVNPMVALRYE